MTKPEKMTEITKGNTYFALTGDRWVSLTERSVKQKTFPCNYPILEAVS